MSQSKNVAPVVPDASLMDSNTTTSTTAGIGTKSNNKNASGSSEVVTVDAIILNIYLKFSYNELEEFVDELMDPEKHPHSADTGQRVSILQQYALESTRKPIDMSNQSNRNKYEPSLFTRKNDAFGLWNFNFLLNLLELDYQYAGANGRDLPKVWKTGPTTNVKVEKVSKDTQQTSIATAQQQQDDGTLKSLLKAVCHQNKYDESYVITWQSALRAEDINTVEHLRTAVANDACWKELSLKPIAKQMIKDYLQLKTISHTSNTTEDPYKKSKATLIGDIHRVRRYFHSVTNTLEHIPDLDRRAVDAAIDEMRLTHDDDGNVLNNIHAYLTTVCLENTMTTEAEHKQQCQSWTEEQNQLCELNQERRAKADDLQKLRSKAEENVNSYAINLQNIIDEEKEVEVNAAKLILEASIMDTSNINGGWRSLHERAGKLKTDYQKKRHDAPVLLKNAQADLDKHTESYQELTTKIAEDDARIQDLDDFLKLNLTEEHRKLTVKYGRGLLLYGPPGTGKSELLKQAAIFAGITMTTAPLSAGELNRPNVGETEKLLVDIMTRANTIRYLICAMTIDEIDGLVPKRDNNAQQFKVDGISVLLSHIEGVNNIPNLIVFGATNRRNVMDEAFLRRMQAKCFVGRPSPKIRKKMLQSLLSKDSHIFTSKRIDFLVKLTTNFSGAAVVALRSSIIVAMDHYREPGSLTDHILLELVDKAAREFNCWFGIGTLPEMCRLYPNIFSFADQHDYYSLKLPDSIPSGRILVDLEAGKCLIELTNEQTLEKTLADEETSTLTLLSRFINGCSSRNIDALQIIDLNFLTKQNAFEEKQIFEILTNLFLECDEYNRSMLIFDIDSLIMLDSQMSKSPSITNIRLYQDIRQRCKTAIVEQSTSSSISNRLKEKWIVMIIKHPFLRRLLMNDIEFKKTPQQIQQERDDEDKHIDEESVKKCPKCLQNYIPSKTSYGYCHYHDGFIFDLDQNMKLTNDQAQTIAQKAKLLASTNRHDQQLQPPKLIWACCLGVYGIDPPCQIGICSLPDDLKNLVGQTQNYTAAVEQHFMNNQVAEQKIKKFLETYRT